MHIVLFTFIAYLWNMLQKKYSVLSIIIGLCLLISPAYAIEEDKSTAVILAYHKIGDNADPNINLRIDQFDAHLRAIKAGGYHVLSLPEIIDHWKNNTPLPDKTLAITFEGAWKSSFTHGMKKLLDHEIPFTLFYSANTINQTLPPEQLKKLARNKLVTLGITTLSADFKAGLNHAIVKHRTLFDTEPAFFAYPFGEYSAAQKETLSKAGLTAAFGLHSAAAYNGSDLYALPRFSMTEHYGSPERFELISQAFPLPARDIMPKAAIFSAPIEHIGFTTSEALTPDLDALSCFISSQNAPKITHINNRVEITPAEPITQNRTRVNCTIPVVNKNETRWRWFGLLLSDNL